MKSVILSAALVTTAALSAPVLAGGHMKPMVMAEDQSVANGMVSASQVVAPANGWLVVHRTNADMKPGPVVGHAPLRKGETADVAAQIETPILGQLPDVLQPKVRIHPVRRGLETRCLRADSEI